MKQLLLLISMFFLSLNVNGQSTEKANTTYEYYCIYYGQLQISGKVKPKKMIWGDEKKEVQLTDAAGVKIEFNNMVDVANYMSKRGWKYMDCKTRGDVYGVFFKKEVSSDSEAKEGLHFDIDFKD